MKTLTIVSAVLILLTIASLIFYPKSTITIYIIVSLFIAAISMKINPQSGIWDSLQIGFGWPLNLVVGLTTYIRTLL